jgi:purine-binding chemotaxis protein CheW
MKKENKGKQNKIVIFRLHKEEFGIGVEHIVEISKVMPITQVPNAPEYICGVINLRGKIVPIIDPAKRMNIKYDFVFSDKSRIVVLDINGIQMGIIVDEVPEVLNISEDQIEVEPEIIKSKISDDFVAGVAKYNKRIILILDVLKMFDFDKKKRNEEEKNG